MYIFSTKASSLLGERLVGRVVEAENADALLLQLNY
jgi:hypothetical protein